MSQLSESKGIFKKINERKQERISKGLPYLTPAFGPAYSPDAGLVLAVGGLYTFKTDADDSLIQRSSLPVIFGASTKGNLSLGGKLNSFWWQDRFRFNLAFSIKDVNDDYFGIGYNNAIEVPLSDSTSGYSWIGASFAGEMLLRLGSNVFGGLNLDYNWTNVRDTNPVMESDPTFQEFGPRNFNAGMGLIVQYDSRDITVNAWHGIYFRLASTFYGPYLEGDNNFQIFVLDTRFYHQLRRPGQTIAFRFRTRAGYGEIPYTDMTTLGGGNGLRGYIKGQFRDESGVIFISEYRHMFTRPDQTLSPHGITAWIGTGSVFDQINEIEKWLPNFGVGYRLELQPRMNLRIDFGMGRDTSGLYFKVNEAF